MYEVNMYIRDYRLNNNGEYPAPTKVSEKKLKAFLKEKKRAVESRENLKLISKRYSREELTSARRKVYRAKKIYRASHLNDLLNNLFDRQKFSPMYVVGKMDTVTDEDNRCYSWDYKETIKHHLEKKRPKVFEKYLKTRMNGMKRELLETSAKICMNPRRIERLLEEKIIDLDDTATFYDL